MSFAPLSRSRLQLHKTRVRSRQHPVEYGDSSQARMIAMTQAQLERYYAGAAAGQNAANS